MRKCFFHSLSVSYLLIGIKKKNLIVLLELELKKNPTQFPNRITFKQDALQPPFLVRLGMFRDHVKSLFLGSLQAEGWAKFYPNSPPEISS